jgi:hypothetical protein
LAADIDDLERQGRRTVLLDFVVFQLLFQVGHNNTGRANTGHDGVFFGGLPVGLNETLEVLDVVREGIQQPEFVTTSIRLLNGFGLEETERGKKEEKRG